jgi:hypothetical protein
VRDWMKMLTFLLLAGCADHDPKPYVEVGLAVQMNSQTDYWVQSARSWQCKNPKFSGQIGYELDNGIRIGLHHDSWILCGTGLNDDPEVYSNELRVTKKWGGQ